MRAQENLKSRKGEKSTNVRKHMHKKENVPWTRTEGREEGKVAFTRQPRGNMSVPRNFQYRRVFSHLHRGIIRRILNLKVVARRTTYLSDMLIA